MEPRRHSIAGCGCLPAAVGQHLCFIMLSNMSAAMLAHIEHIAVFRLHLCPFQPLISATERTGHKKIALVGVFKLPLNVGQTFDRRRGHQKNLFSFVECSGSPFRQQNRIAFTVNILRITVNLIHKQIPRRHGTQPHRRVRSGHHQHAARKILGQHGVATVPGTRRSHQFF